MTIPHMAMNTIILDGCGSAPQLLLARFARIESGWQLADMRAPFWRCYLPLERGGTISFAGSDHELDPQRLMLIPPDTAARASHQRDFRKAYANIAWKPKRRQARAMIHELPSLPAERQCLRRIVNTGDGAGLSLFMLACSCRALASLDDTAFNEQASPSQAIARAIDYIHSLPADPPSNARLARLLGLHPGSFVRRFSAEMGCSPQHYSREFRLAQSCRMLVEGDAGIEQISEACGFADRAHFTRAFSKRWNCPPATFRQRNRS